MSFVCKSHSLFGILLSGQSSDTWLTCPNCLHPIMEDIIQNLPKGCINSVSRIISVISEAHTCIYHPIITECNITGASKSCLQMSKLYCVNFIMLMLYKRIETTETKQAWNYMCLDIIEFYILWCAWKF